MSDWHLCSCGWKSADYQDGAEYAQQDWVKHILERGATIIYPDGTKKVQQHPTLREEFDCIPERLASRIANLRYDELADLFRQLGRKLAMEAESDAARGRHILSRSLSKLVQHVEGAAGETEKAWSVCKPFMTE